MKIKCKAKDLQDEITRAFPDEVDPIERIKRIEKELIQRKLRRNRGSALVQWGS